MAPDTVSGSRLSILAAITHGSIPTTVQRLHRPLGDRLKASLKVSLGLVAVSLLALHLLAIVFAAAPVVTNPADLGGAVIHQMIHTIAFFCQFVVPPAFLIGATVSYVKRSRSIRLFEDIRAAPASGPAAAALTWRQFESLVAEGFRQRGFQVIEKGGAAPDGGVDLILARGSERFLVQCKQWRAQQVPVTIVRELYGVMAATHAAGGYVVTSGRFTQDAIAFAAGRNIELIDRKTLPALMGVAENSTAKLPNPAGHDESCVSAKPLQTPTEDKKSLYGPFTTEVKSDHCSMRKARMSRTE